MFKMRIVMIGGNGFIGSSFADYIKNKEVEIICCDLIQTFHRNEHVTYIYMKEETMDFYRSLLKKDDIVIVLKWRGVPANFMDTGRQLVENNIVGTMLLIEACVEKKVKKIIFASSGGAIYGNCENLPIKEEEKKEPISLYAVQKLMVEDYLNYIARVYEMNVIILRIANPFGPNQKPFTGQGIVATFLACNLLGKRAEIHGDGNFVRDYLYIDDLSECFFLCCKQEMMSGTYNVGSGIGISIFEICAFIEKVTGRPMYYDQYQIGRGQVKNNILDCSKIKREIGWESHIGMECGIREMLSVMMMKDNIFKDGAMNLKTRESE